MRALGFYFRLIPVLEYTAPSAVPGAFVVVTKGGSLIVQVLCPETLTSMPGMNSLTVTSTNPAVSK